MRKKGWKQGGGLFHLGGLVLALDGFLVFFFFYNDDGSLMIEWNNECY